MIHIVYGRNENINEKRIELNTSYIFVEGSSYLYDELMAFTGLDDKDITNYFLVAQYIKCKEKFNI